MLAGFQISHSDGLKGSHIINHHSFYKTEPTLLNLLSAPSFTTCCIPIDLLAGGEGTRCPLPNYPTPVLGPSIRPRFYRSQGQTHYKVVKRKYDY